MCRRVLASASSFAILCGAIMLASRADAITLAVPSGLRAAAATTDLSQQVQYYCGSGWGYGGYGDGGSAIAAMATVGILLMATAMAGHTTAMVATLGHTTAMADIPAGAIGCAGGDAVPQELARTVRV
jgi:hypothetical protein